VQRSLVKVEVKNFMTRGSREKIFFCRIPLCTLINQHLSRLAAKFPQVKFLKSISTTCIPNYPDKNVPTIFIYKDGEMTDQWIGAIQLGGMNLTQDSEFLVSLYAWRATVT